jgi:hypothetical protein
MYSPAQFTEELRTFGDPTSPRFTGWPATVAGAAAQWATLLDHSTGTLVPPVLPAVRQGAKEVLQQQLEILFRAGAGSTALPAAFQVYAASLALGMGPGFVGFPPPVPLQLAALLALAPRNPTALEAMTVMGLLVMNWLGTGTVISTASGFTTRWV